MSDLLIFDPDDNLLAVLSNDAEEACPFWEAPFKEILNGTNEFQFTAAADHPDAKHIKGGNQVAFWDKDNALRLFVIDKPEKVAGPTTGPQILAVCEPAMNELSEEIVEDVRPQNVTLEQANTKLLAGTRWKPGITADLGINSTNYYYSTVTEGLEKNIEVWGGEIRDRIELNAAGNKIAGRFIDQLPRRGKDTGKLWEMDKDILSIRQKTDFHPVTALYGRGSSLEIEETGGYTRLLDFADVEWKKSKGDPVDKPLGQKFVGDPEALQRYGKLNTDGTRRHRKGIYENSEIEDPEELLWNTWYALQEQKHPLDNFEMDVFLLEQLSGYEHEKVRLGDTTIAIAREFSNSIEVEERILVYEYDVADPDNTGTVEFGRYINPYYEDDRIDKIEGDLNKKISGPITDKKIKNVKPGIPSNVRAEGGFDVVQLHWDYNSSIYISNYEVYASEIKGFTPDESNLVWRGKVSAYAHKAKRNQQWYFRVRAINTHGVAGDFSVEVMASTVRIISDDILFGPDIAKELRELSKTADLLADDSISMDMISQQARESLKLEAKQYTDEEIQEVRNFLGEKFDEYGNEFININAEIDDINGQLKYKVEQGIFDEITDSIEYDMSQLRIKSDEIETRVADIRIGGRNLIIRNDELKDTAIDSEGETYKSSYNSTMKGFIVVEPGQTMTFSQIKSDDDHGDSFPYYFRYAFYDDNSNLIRRESNNDSEFQVVVPDNASRLRVSYWTDSKVQVERGTKATDWTPAPEEMDQRMTQSESVIRQLSNDITLKVNRDDLISEINLRGDGTVRIKGSLIELDGTSLIRDAVIGTAAIANAAITRAKLGTAVIGTAQIDDLAVTGAKIAKATIDNAHIASLSASKITAGTMDADMIKIRGGSATEYLTIDGNKVEQRGTYTRRWFNHSATYDTRVMHQNGHIRFRNDSLNRSLYYGEFGISVYLDGSGDYLDSKGAASGTILFWDPTYSPIGSEGLTLNSYWGAVALESDKNRIVLNSELNINLDSRTAPIFLRPHAADIPGYNTFMFNVNRDNDPALTDGYLMYGSEENGYGMGLRMSKRGTPTLTIVNGDYISGGNTTFDVGNIRTNDIKYRNGSKSVYWNDTSTANTGAAFSNTLKASGIRAMSGSDDIYLATNNGGAVRVTGALGYNEGKGVTYRNIAASGFVQLKNASSFVGTFSLLALKPDKNEATKLINDVGIARMVGGKYPTFEAFGKSAISSDADENGTDMSKAVGLLMKSTQEIDKRILSNDDEINWLKVENQLQKNEIVKLKERIQKLEEKVA